ncbi:ankyrin repeat domain-containing protein [Flavobacterium aquicola]|uniref:Ankyrin repeat protein n=1 Tax=Flavobacterium aquicola TaxID=1682742 RepID=A0A3E0ETV5_9FLAO|nr:ankyrin repeat domain-containing protein [Flavobacterium aquicola]REH01598.1 ankyrin repeat protein [Flavobacterium aquicola]
MKKSIIYLGVALIAATSVLSASNLPSSSNASYEAIPSSEIVSPLSIAIWKGDLNSVKKFVEYGTDVSEKSNGMTPLMVAARYNKVEIIKFLLSKGADAKTKNEYGLIALKYAELSNAREAIELLKQ